MSEALGLSEEGEVDQGISELGHLKNLTRLLISENQLTGSMPPGFSNIHKLEAITLDVAGCRTI